MEVLNERPDLINFVTSVAQERGIKEFTITNVKTNEKGEGFLGQIFIITLQDKANKKLEIVIKASFAADNIRKAIPIRECFENEIYFYTKIHPTFTQFGEECGVVSSADIIPKCYKTLVEEGREFLCLENLTESKFEVFDKTGLLDNDHVSQIFKTYGRFHAYSFALQDQKPEEYTQVVGKIYDIFGLFLNNPNGHYKSRIRSFGEIVQKFLIQGEDDEVIKKFEKYKNEGIVNVFTDCIMKENDYSVILHGDCWSNNIMFKYETSGPKKLVDLRLIDLQLVRVGSPVLDLSYCLYSGSSKTVFNNLEQHLKTYYESFSSFLIELGSDPEKLFSFTTLKEQWRKYAKWGMIMAFTIWKMKTTNREDLLDLSDLKDNEQLEVDKVKFNEDVYCKRVRDILYHMSEIDAL